MPPTRDEILSWLRETDPQRLEQLWRRADDLRRAVVGDDVQLRGLIEISNHCRRSCTYCGIRQRAKGVTRYRMTQDQIVACAAKAGRFGYGTVVVQAGEDPALTTDWVRTLVHRIKAEAGVAITLSLGERPHEDLVAWKAAGADRYLLRFETSDPVLFARIHPRGRGFHRDRFEMLADLRALGFEVGSGVMVGIPGQTWDTLADDLQRFRDLDLDMIGVGPFIASPRTPLAGRPDPRSPRTGPRGRADHLQGPGPGAPAVPPGQPARHHRPGHPQHRVGPRDGPPARRQRPHAQRHAPGVSHPLRDLPRQGLHHRDGREVQRLHEAAHLVHWQEGWEGAGGKAAGGGYITRSSENSS